MDSLEYTAGVLRTESSRYDHQNVCADDLYAALKLFAYAAQAVDTIKRGLYYGKPMDREKLRSAIGMAQSTAQNYLELTSVSPTIDAIHHHTFEGYGDNQAVKPRTIHSALGLATESGEIIECILAGLDDGFDIDYGNFFEEMGDISWYQALGLKSGTDANPDFDFSQEHVWDRNLAKLKARYPDKFDSDKAHNRNLDDEKLALSI